MKKFITRIWRVVAVVMVIVALLALNVALAAPVSASYEPMATNSDQALVALTAEPTAASIANEAPAVAVPSRELVQSSLTALIVWAMGGVMITIALLAEFVFSRRHSRAPPDTSSVQTFDANIDKQHSCPSGHHAVGATLHRSALASTGFT